MGPKIQNIDYHPKGEKLVSIVLLVNGCYKIADLRRYFGIVGKMTSNYRGPGPPKVGPKIQNFDYHPKVGKLSIVLLVLLYASSVRIYTWYLEYKM